MTLTYIKLAKKNPSHQLTVQTPLIPLTHTNKYNKTLKIDLFISLVCVCVCALWHEHREARTICGSWSFFQHLGSRGWTRVVSLGGKRLYPLGHLIPWGLDKHWWWMSFLIYSAHGSSYPQTRPPTVRSYSASFPPTPRDGLCPSPNLSVVISLLF